RYYWFYHYFFWCDFGTHSLFYVLFWCVPFCVLTSSRGLVAHCAIPGLFILVTWQ
ncbi:hypothetical protein OFV77_005074, partial [Salmonella enterica]|nr:hypothetical protein [Salmonella enterica]